MSQKIPLNGFKWTCTSKFNEDFIKSFDEESDKGYIHEVDVKYPKRLQNLHNEITFLPERTKSKKN